MSNYQNMKMHKLTRTDQPINLKSLSYSYFYLYRYSDICRYREVTSSLNITRRVNNGSCYRYYQAPGEFPRGECVALTYQHFYYMSDEDCLHRKSPLCVATDRD